MNPFTLAQELANAIVEDYDAAEDYSEGLLEEGLSDASEAEVTPIARKVFKGAVEMAIQTLLLSDVGLEALYQIKSYRKEENTDKVTDTNRIHFVEAADTITVISTNFAEPQPGDYRGIPLAKIPHCSKCSYKRAKAIAEAIARFTIENPPEGL